MTLKKAIIGYSGHAFVVLDACKKVGLDISYYCEKEKITYNPYNIKYIGDESSENFDWQALDGFVLGIGDNHIRIKVAKLVAIKNKEIYKVIHPTSILNDFVTIGEGSLVCSNAIINPLTVIGDYCIINSGAIIEHECMIEAGTHIAPGAVLAGNVKVGKLTFIGANCVIKQGIRIGNNVTIGAGSVVLKDVPDNEVWAGNPAKKLDI